jgi:hypothetical protein
MTIAQAHLAARAGGSVAAAPAGLDWYAFSARYFPGRRRHDLEAVRAYGGYKQRAEAGSVGSGGVQVWEDEGGAAR